MSAKRKRQIRYLTFTLAPVLLIILMIAPALVHGEGEIPPPVLTGCTGCHDDTTLITGKQTAWEESTHGTGEAYLRGTSKGCAGCHSGGGFSAMIAGGMEPNSAAMVGDPNPTRQDCRACHQTHETYTGTDWALETTAPVDFYTTGIEGVFDGGKGNLCAKCHQPRTKAPAVTGGSTVTGISSHWGPHHGPESTMMMGTNGAGPAAAGSPSAHYSAVGDTCATCHMGSADNHSFAPAKATCQGCHASSSWAAGATSFDVNGVQTTVQAKLDNLKTLLVNAGIIGCELDEEGVEDCSAIVTSLPDNQAYALWNFNTVGAEDGSKGVHNPDYANSLLDASIQAMTPCEGTPVLGIGAPGPFWASYADYQNRLLSVSYSLSNTGTINAYNVNVTASSATNGVTMTSAVPYLVGDIAAGNAAPVTLVYHVPDGVATFKTTSSASAEEACGTSHTYGPAVP